jgi:hypothetical protein
MEVSIEIKTEDALKTKADVLILKYAQEFYGADSMAFSKLAVFHKNLERKLPKPQEFLFIESLGSLGASHVLFTGVTDIFHFRYKEIREFSFASVKYLLEIKPDAEHICFTVHGVNYGLDETEAFKSELAGIIDAISKGLYPPSLKKVTIAEIHKPRAERLGYLLQELLVNGTVRIEEKGGTAKRSLETSRLIGKAGINSEDKPLIFVAMPFDKKMEDIFHYGIQNAVNQAGFLCERVDKITFTGDILDLIKRRIQAASLVIADLTTANPNVYLEVGYAWGLGKPTVLLAQDAQELKFDIQGQKCIIYSGIRELEEKLGSELLGLGQRRHHGKSP